MKQFLCGNIILALSAGLALLSTCNAPPSQENAARWKLKDGMVPDSSTAIAVARIVWNNVYGTKAANKKSFSAALKDGRTWCVNGNSYPALGFLYAEIDKETGAISAVNRYK